MRADGVIDVTALGLGTANLGNLHREMSDDQADAILTAAWDAGVRHFDSAPHYGLGLSEQRLGRFLRTRPRDEFVVSTKVGRLLARNPAWNGERDTDNGFAVYSTSTRVWDFSHDGIRRSLDDSLERLGLDGVDTLYLHDPDRHDLGDGLAEALNALAELRDQGVVRSVGVGSMDATALETSVRFGVLDVLMVAGRYTLASQDGMAAVLDECRNRGVTIVNASVFNSGLLATNDPAADSRFEYGSVPQEILARVKVIADIARDYSVDLPTAALQYSFRSPLVRTVVVGSSSPAQIVENARRVQLPIPAEFWERVEGLSLAGPV